MTAVPPGEGDAGAGTGEGTGLRGMAAGRQTHAQMFVSVHQGMVSKGHTALENSPDSSSAQPGGSNARYGANKAHAASWPMCCCCCCCCYRGQQQGQRVQHTKQRQLTWLVLVLV
jgi:hypothetical protein